jgi:S1-C subfamily serine protease
MKLPPKALLISLAAIAGAAGLLAASIPDDSDADGSLSAAIGPIVYRLDESPSDHGFHYTFYGNGFFINEDGYLLTVAHVLESFNNGGQASIQVSRPNSPPQLLALSVIASDVAHDVAILRAAPNPFTSHCRVTYLPLTADPVVPGQAVLALSLHPPKLRNAQSFQIPVEDRSPGQVLSYESTQLDKSSPPADLFLLSHPVTRGQSGSPVVAADSRAVVGLIEGRWLRSSAISLTQSQSAASRTDTRGAAIPIRYAISLLNQKEVHWHANAPGATKSEPSVKP